MTRRVLVVGLMLGLTATAIVTANALRGPRQDGPLQTNSRVNIKFPLADDEVFVWGMDLPFYGDPSVGDIQIDSIEPVGTRGLEMLGLVLNNAVLQADGVCLSYGTRTVARFPPPEVPTREVRGALLSAAGGKVCANHPSVLVGVRRLPGSSDGRVEAMRMLYRHRGTAYELVMPYSLDICRGAADAQGRRVPCTAIPTPGP
jgi:hypothetical protein